MNTQIELEEFKKDFDIKVLVTAKEIVDILTPKLESLKTNGEFIIFLDALEAVRKALEKTLF